MMGKSKIDWCDRVWNPITGCSKMAVGCKNCYAEKMANRLVAMGVPGYDDNIIKNGKWTGNINLLPNKLCDPEKWRKPQIIFVNSMSDLFHENVPDEFIKQVFMEMAIWAPGHNCNHKYIVLTKRPERMRDFMNSHRDYMKDNIWLGISISTQEEAEKMLPMLCRTPAGKRVVSVEPILEYINLCIDYKRNVWSMVIDNLDWIIAGCESGANARPDNIDWFRVLQHQCERTKKPFFLKQMTIDGKLVKEPFLDGRQWLEFPDSF
jgi:protein gp37